MSHGRIDELYELRRMLIDQLSTCEGFGWNDEERKIPIKECLQVVEAEIEELEVKIYDRYFR
jgi:hypothetical protein